MCRDKAVTRILLILSVVRAAAAAPAIIRQRSLEVTKDVTPTSEKRANADDESSHPFQQMDNNLPSTSGALPSRDDTSPEDLHSWPSEVPQLQPANELPRDSSRQGDWAAVPPPHDDPWRHMPPDDSPEDPPLPNQQANLVSPEEMVYDGSTWSITSEPPPVLDDNHWWQLANLASFGETVNVGSPVTSSTTSEASYWGQQLQNGWHHDGPISSSDSHSEGSMPVDSPPASPGSPQVHGDPLPASGSPQMHDNPPAASGNPQLHDDWLEGFDSSSRSNSDFPIIGGSSSPSAFGSEDLIPVDSEAPQPLESEASPSAPETHTFFNDALKKKLKVIAGVGAVAGVLAGGAFGVKKLIKGHSHGSQPAGRDLASRGVVGRGASMRNEDLRLLSILTRMALERLD